LAIPAISRRFLAVWADMDWNAHMANTAFFNKIVDARVLALAEKKAFRWRSSSAFALPSS
jgi:hypothetical protein